MVGLTREQRAERAASSESAALSRAAKIRQPLRAPLHHSVRDADEVARSIRENHLSADDGTDKFFIDQSEIPPGWTYAWRRRETAGKIDQQYQNSLARRGWQTVPQDRHPHIEMDQSGMVLMEIPTMIADERRLAAEREARATVQIKEQQLADTPEGHGPRANVPGRAVITKSYEQIPD